MKHLSLTLRFSVVAAAIGLSCLGVAALLGSASRVEARGLGPEVTGGTHPYVSFSGLIPSAGTITLYTVPNDRILVVTGAAFQGVALHEDGTLKVHERSSATITTGMLAQGNGHVPFAPGSNVILTGPPTNPYFVQGYLAHP